jgi:hypothetical protein
MLTHFKLSSSSPAFTADVAGALRGFGSDVRSQRRVLSSAMTRHVAATTGVAVWSGATVGRGMRTTADAVNQLADALRATGALLESQAVDIELGTGRSAGKFVITDRTETRC